MFEEAFHGTPVRQKIEHNSLLIPKKPFEPIFWIFDAKYDRLFSWWVICMTRYNWRISHLTSKMWQKLDLPKTLARQYMGGMLNNLELFQLGYSLLPLFRTQVNGNWAMAKFKSQLPCNVACGKLWKCLRVDDQIVNIESNIWAPLNINPYINTSTPRSYMGAFGSCEIICCWAIGALKL